jgi:DNA-binding IclR family transcriptional regulator
MASSRRTVISKVTLILLKYLDGTHSPLTEITAATGLPPSTTHRLVCDLATWRILERTADGRYGVGPALRRIAASGFVVDVRAQAPLVLAELVQVFDAEARLGVLDNHHVAYLAQAPGGRPARSTPTPTLPAPATALGKALLAFSSPRLCPRLSPAA